MQRQLVREQLPGTDTVRWWCQGCNWDVSEPPASFADALVAFLKHICANNEIVFRRGGE